MEKQPEEVAVLEVATIEESTLENKGDEALESKILDNMAPAGTKEPEEIQTSLLRLEPSNEIVVWEAKRGSSLKKILNKWSSEEQVNFIWATSKDYTLDKDIFISGTFKNAVDILFSQGLKNAPDYHLTQDTSYELRVEN